MAGSSIFSVNFTKLRTHGRFVPRRFVPKVEMIERSTDVIDLVMQRSIDLAIHRSTDHSIQRSIDLGIQRSTDPSIKLSNGCWLDR